MKNIRQYPSQYDQNLSENCIGDRRNVRRKYGLPQRCKYVDEMEQ